MCEIAASGFEGLRLFQPASWEQIPDLGLYMDQVITYIGRVYQPIYGDDIKRFLSAPMINNYVKGKLIPRPTGKKYSREQIALLIMIVALKQTAGMEDIRRMLALREGETTETLYTAFCGRFSQVVHEISDPEKARTGALSAALEYAILASGFHAGCVAALATANGEQSQSRQQSR